MPDVTVRNSTPSPLNISFGVTTPLAWTNEVQPKQTIRLNLAMFVHTFEAREDRGDNRFSAGESWQKFGEITAATAAGAGAVVMGTAGVIGGWFGLSAPVAALALAGAGRAWGAAFEGGKAYAKNANGVVLQIPGVWVPHFEKHYSVRIVEEKYALWDDDEGRRIGW